MATKAKWYHIVTLKMRVSRTSYIRVERVMRKSPTYVPKPARGGVFSNKLKRTGLPVKTSAVRRRVLGGGTLLLIV
jgi:hypothetical protein